MSKKKYLVTGASGFVGSNLVRKIVSLGHKPVILVRKQTNLWRIKDIIKDIEIFETDISDYSQLKSTLLSIKPSHIFHLAVYGANQRNQKEFDKIINANILGTINLIDICSQIGFDSFVNTGSSSEYGIKNEPMSEGMKLEPINLYGVSKVASTLAANFFSKKYNMPIVTLRLFSPYGYYEDKQRLFAYLFLSILEKKKIDLSNSDYVRDFVFIEVVVNAYLSFSEGEKFYGEIFNIGSGSQTSISELIDKLEGIINRKLNISWNVHTSNQEEPKMWISDIGKMGKSKNWSAKISLDEGLEKTYEWFKLNYQLYS